MKVTMIDYTGACSPDPWYAARLLIYAKNTRLEQNADTRARIQGMGDTELMDELNKVARSVRTSWEFCEYKLQIENVTRAFTHQLVRTRFGVAFAQQSQRTVDFSDGIDTLIPDSVKNRGLESHWQACVRFISATYATLRGHDVPTQDARGVLPTNIYTNIFSKFDLRCVADLCGKRDNLRAQDEYGDVMRAIKNEILAVHPWAEMFLCPERTRTPALDALLKHLLGDRSPASVPEINDALKEIDMLKATWG
jgi:flavin-dependent thymidylate synthase